MAVEGLTQKDLIASLGATGKLTPKQAEELLKAWVEILQRELEVGEKVQVPELGVFSTETTTGAIEGDKVVLPEVDVVYEPAASLVKAVVQAQKDHPELFVAVSEDDTEEEEDEITAAVDQAKAVKESENVAAAAEAEAALPDVPRRESFIEFLDLGSVRVEKEVLELVPLELAQKLGAVPIELEEGVLTVAMTNPDDFDIIQSMRKQTGLVIKPALATKDGINAILDQYTGFASEVQDLVAAGDFISKKDVQAAANEEVGVDDDSAPTAHIVFSILKRAVKEKASDIHIEPYERRVVVRFRLDGILVQKVELPKEVQQAITARFKILANLKIDEQRLPQDGRFSVNIERRRIDFRFSTIPIVFGEKIVMRILDKSVGILALEDTGIIDRNYEVLTRNMERSHGMILVTGPTGSGKTTTLYAVLGKLMKPDVNILTLEDPVEYQIEGINQSQVHHEIGYSFGTGMRAVVRQDPDIVMLGEIRDHETADMAVNAALTGHIVISTLHTNDSGGAFPRLIDMGVEPFLLTSSIHTVVAQRLARRVCQECKEEYKPDPGTLKEVKDIIDSMPPEGKKLAQKEGIHFYKGKGCDKCNGTGYKGRLTVTEVLDVNEAVQQLVLHRESNTRITEQSIKDGMMTMQMDGIMKVLRGFTSIEEVWRVSRE